MPFCSLRSALPCALFALLGVFSGCETQPTHEVISVTDLSPRQVEVGDRMVIQGSGFPLAADIRQITVRLSGMLSRPGMAPCPRPVTVTLADPATDGMVLDPITEVEHEALYAAATIHTLRVEGGNRIEFTITEEILRTLTTCPGERTNETVPHATVSLSGPRAGVSVRVETVLGTTLASARSLRGPRIDVLSPWGRSLQAEHVARSEADGALAFVGLHLAAVHPPEGGLQIERVAPGSPADEAGLVDGDVIERLDGATLLGVSDFRPSPGTDLAMISVRRGDAVEDRPVRVSALTRGVSYDVVATAVALLVALAIVAFGMSPRRGFVSWATERFAPVRFARDPEGTALGFGALATTALAVPFGQAFFALDPEVSLAHLAAMVATLLLSAMAARAAMTHPTARLTLGVLARRASMELPALCGLVAVILLSGEMHVQGITASQGGAPWAWTLFRNPALLVLGATHVASLAMFAPVAGSTSPRWIRVSAWSLIVARASLASVLFLGGARVPGVELSVQDAAVGFQMLGALVLMAKTWGLVAGARALAPRVAAAHAAVLTALSLRYLVPLGVMGVTLVMVGDAFVREVPPTAWELATMVSSMATFAACAVGVGVMAAPRVARAFSST